MRLRSPQQEALWEPNAVETDPPWGGGREEDEDASFTFSSHSYSPDTGATTGRKPSSWRLFTPAGWSLLIVASEWCDLASARRPSRGTINSEPLKRKEALNISLQLLITCNKLPWKCTALALRGNWRFEPYSRTVRWRWRASLSHKGEMVCWCGRMLWLWASQGHVFTGEDAGRWQHSSSLSCGNHRTWRFDGSKEMTGGDFYYWTLHHSYTLQHAALNHNWVKTTGWAPLTKEDRPFTPTFYCCISTFCCFYHTVCSFYTTS